MGDENGERAKLNKSQYFEAETHNTTFFLLFLKDWVRSPSVIAAIVASGQSLFCFMMPHILCLMHDALWMMPDALCRMYDA